MVRAVRWVHELWFGVSPLGDSLAAFGLYERFDVTSLSGHRQDIECLTLVDHHGTERIVSACLGGQIRIWDLEQHRCLMSAFGVVFNLPFYFINTTTTTRQRSAAKMTRTTARRHRGAWPRWAIWLLWAAGAEKWRCGTSTRTCAPCCPPRRRSQAMASLRHMTAVEPQPCCLRGPTCSVAIRLVCCDAGRGRMCLCRSLERRRRRRLAPAPRRRSLFPPSAPP